MPELPEVETIRLGLRRTVLAKRIAHVEVRKTKIVRGTKAAFIKKLAGASFTDIERRGKLLIFTVSAPHAYLLVHLKMTGQLIYVHDQTFIAGGHPWPSVAGGLPNKYSHIIFGFADGSTLYFNDMRQFGFMQVVDDKTLEKTLARFGVDPLSDEFTWDAFRTSLAGRRVSLKAALLNQQLIAGIGNIYADEIAFHAGVKPQRRVHRLTQKELLLLYRATKHILARAMKYGGTTFRDFRDTKGGRGNYTELLKAYGRTGQACKRPQCRQVGATIRRTVTAGRGTHFCPSCQK